MNYIKKMARSAYENMIEDDFLEPIAQEEIYLIMQKHRDRVGRLKRGRSGVNGTSGEQHPTELSTSASSILQELADNYELDCVFRSLPQ